VDDLDRLLIDIKPHLTEKEHALVWRAQWEKTWAFLDLVTPHTDRGPSDKEWAAISLKAARKVLPWWSRLIS
jgi:hypothetical protein